MGRRDKVHEYRDAHTGHLVNEICNKELPLLLDEVHEGGLEAGDVDKWCEAGCEQTAAVQGRPAPVQGELRKGGLLGLVDENEHGHGQPLQRRAERALPDTTAGERSDGENRDIRLSVRHIRMHEGRRGTSDILRTVPDEQRQERLV